MERVQGLRLSSDKLEREAIAQLQELGVTAEIHTESNGEQYFTIKRVNTTLTLHTAYLPDYLQELQARRAKGCYTLDEAAQMIAKNASPKAKSLLTKLLAATRANTLHCYLPEDTEPFDHSSRVYEIPFEVYWKELNSWLEITLPRVFEEFQFPAPSPTLERSPKSTAEKAGVTKREILRAGWAMPRSAPKLENILNDLPKWVSAAYSNTGRPGGGINGSHLWNPAMLAVCLATRTPQNSGHAASRA